ncbi:type IX secretion system membrane protein PorP/SprF [Flavobacterium sp. Fl-77]|uniref:Type IX secretion system membrane protein PorP/SprF n=1 Tax=Flavobacterium flavipigmentatum TaxID=2893884 RepID=A0AAJ2SB37_9FLAO|nr:MULTISPECIES: type IX secretion system membrane protein PorP/SprF [unclassified Flavobacterium]MDX6183557.1 type IX secretion system membrane protein PorP/SprF [Flavobacterium sp. Fl-33]MDX6187041.1 type IX secretion system membrane protein PorP/SprF [Flavobacterium sp. Fl-77]UFH40227.1 type IX secretion system membrane protein PorP/SprF [Flavobacterium sp. F-70]
MKFRINLIVIFLITSYYSFSQEGIPVYSDYLSDNYYLIHPSMAGAANCAKIRLTARKQWFGQDDAPSLQTLSFNGRLGERSGAGIIVFNDKNGYHSQKGFKVTYAHHIMFSRDAIDLNQLSFGISGGIIQSQLDETSFGGTFDPIVYGSIQKDSYFNVDFGASYNFLDFYAHATIQGLVETRRELYTDYETDNVRKFLVSAGYVFGKRENITWEPSVLFQLFDTTKEKSLDVNLKAYKNMNFGSLWAGLSYRRSFDGAQYRSGSGVAAQKLQYITPLVGVNYKNFMFAYTYSNVTGDVKFDTGGYHQLTLGINLFCTKERYDCNCPAIN